jgi:gluconolactonase
MIDKLVDPAAQPEKICAGFKFTEGPVFSRRGYLLFTDIPTNRIMKWEKGTVTVLRENSNGANGLTFDHQGRLLACENGRVTRTEKDGTITVLAGEMKRPNDLVYAIDGSVYFTDMPAATVHQVTRGGEARVVARDCRRPNGIALAPNQLKLYIADPGSGNIRVYDVLADGALEKGRTFAEGVRADGIKTDETGHLWAAAGSGIWIFDPEGKHLGTVEIPEGPSNCCWGEGFRGLYITARTSVYRIDTKVPGTRTY